MAQTKFYSYGEMDFIRQGEGIEGSVSTGDDGTANRVPSKVAKNTIYLNERLTALDNVGANVLTLASNTTLSANNSHVITAGSSYAMPDSSPAGTYVNLISSGATFNVTTATKFPNDSKSIAVRPSQSLQMVKTADGWEYSRLNGGESWTRPQADERYVQKESIVITNSTASDAYFVVASGEGWLNSLFRIEGEVGGGHRSAVIYAGVAFGQNPTLSVISNVGFGGATFSEVMITTEPNVDPTYTKKYLLVKVKAKTAVLITMESHGAIFDEWKLSQGTLGASSANPLSGAYLNLANGEGLMTNTAFRASSLFDAGNRVFSASNKVNWDDGCINGRPKIARDTTGLFGSVQVDDYKNGWAGYAIDGKVYFMRATGGGFGLYRDDPGGAAWLIRMDTNNVSIIGSNLRESLILWNHTLEYRTAYGTMSIGPMNSSFCHFFTDRPAYHFAQRVYVENTIEIYNGGDTSISHRGVIDHGQRVYSPRNPQPVDRNHNHTAAQGNCDYREGGIGLIGTYMFAQLNPDGPTGAYYPGSLCAGYLLHPCSVDGDWDDMVAASLQGTWKCCGVSRRGWAPNLKGGNEWDVEATKTLWFRVW